MPRKALLALIVVLPLLTTCNGESPTGPRSMECVNNTFILIAEPSYLARSENPASDRGHLRKDCPAGATYCYYLDTTPLNPGAKGNLLEPFVGKEVLIVGKHITAGSGVEIWPGAICQLRCDGGTRPCLD